MTALKRFDFKRLTKASWIPFFNCLCPAVSCHYWYLSEFNSWMSCCACSMFAKLRQLGQRFITPRWQTAENAWKAFSFRPMWTVLIKRIWKGFWKTPLNAFYFVHVYKVSESNRTTLFSILLFSILLLSKGRFYNRPSNNRLDSAKHLTSLCNEGNTQY